MKMSQVPIRSQITPPIACTVQVALWAAVACLCMALWPTLPAHAQSASQRYPNSPHQATHFPNYRTQRYPDNTFPEIGGNPTQRALVMHQLKALRQKQLLKDTRKLLKLATELSAEVKRPKSDPVGKQQLRKASQIEKLARNVEQNMLITYGTRPTTPDLFPAPFPNSR